MGRKTGSDFKTKQEVTSPRTPSDVIIEQEINWKHRKRSETMSNKAKRDINWNQKQYSKQNRKKLGGWQEVTSHWDRK